MNNVSPLKAPTENVKEMKEESASSVAEEPKEIPIPSLGGKLRYKLVEYIILAEFDIDTGSEVRIQHPNPPEGYEER